MEYGEFSSIGNSMDEYTDHRSSLDADLELIHAVTIINTTRTHQRTKDQLDIETKFIQYRLANHKLLPNQ